VSCNVPVAEAIHDGTVLPERVQEALGALVGAAREGLLALSVSVGLGVLSELLEEEVTELVGPKGYWNPDRTAVRDGHEDGEVTLGGRRVAVKRPRVRTADGESELRLVTYQHVASRDRLAHVVLERVLAGVSTRKYRRAQDPVGEPITAGERSTSKSSRLYARTLCGACVRVERIARPSGAIARGCNRLRRAPLALSENELQPAALDCRVAEHPAGHPNEPI
jgi:Transposase, Mutator family